MAASDILGEQIHLNCPTYKHVGKAFKTELPQQTKDWKRHFNVQSGQHNAREECNVKQIRLLSPFDMKTEFQDLFVIPLSSQIIIMKYGKHQKNEAV